MNPIQARTQANVAHRAKNLFNAGYTVEAWGEGTDLYVMTSPEGRSYVVDADKQTCQCPYFRNSNEDLQEGDEPILCKHVLGIAKLLLDSEAAACEMDTETYLRWKAYEESK